MGAAIGGALGLVVVLGGNPDYREQGGWGAFASMIGGGALVGLADAAAAVAGGAIALLVIRSSSRRDGLFRRAVVSGAACGAAAPWVVLGVVDGILRGDWAWMYPLCVVAVVAAIIAAIAAEALLGRADRREQAAVPDTA